MLYTHTHTHIYIYIVFDTNSTFVIRFFSSKTSLMHKMSKYVYRMLLNQRLKIDQRKQYLL